MRASIEKAGSRTRNGRARASDRGADARCLPVVRASFHLRSSIRGIRCGKVAGRNAVVCVEPSASMRDLAIRRRDELGAVNTEFVDAVAEDLSAFTDASFDRVVSIHGAPFLPWDAEGLTARESLRVVRPGGHVAFVTTTPGWRMDHEPAATEQPMARDALAEQLEPLGFTPRDVLVEMDYGSVDEALATWGCIYGADAIDYLLERQTSRLTWSLRIWHHMA